MLWEFPWDHGIEKGVAQSPCCDNSLCWRKHPQHNEQPPPSLQHTMYIRALVCTHIHIHVTSVTYMTAVILNVIFLLLFKFYNQQQIQECKCSYSSVMQPCPLQHMLSCFAKATLTACLTAASVCYRHGAVSTPLSTPSLGPSLLYAAAVLPPSLSPCSLGSGTHPITSYCLFLCKIEPFFGNLLR